MPTKTNQNHIAPIVKLRHLSKITVYVRDLVRIEDPQKVIKRFVPDITTGARQQRHQALCRELRNCVRKKGTASATPTKTPQALHKQSLKLLISKHIALDCNFDTFHSKAWSVAKTLEIVPKTMYRLQQNSVSLKIVVHVCYNVNIPARSQRKHHKKN